ncbi:nuclear transport factor 2 family protein [Candidatus Bathyarchaeota archaeon]|nr:nuclear transport factor 2 family protein [Candidatus Bathyarchaeota archaeon]
MRVKSWLTLGLVLIVIVGGAAYLGSRSEVIISPTPTTSPTTPTPTSTTTATPTVPPNDTDAVNQLLSDFHDSVRSRSLDNLLSLFSDEAVLTTADQLRFTGKTQIGGYFSYMFRRLKGEIDIQVTEATVTVEGSRATARLRILTNNELGVEFFELAKVKGRWMISTLTLFKF